MPFSNHELLGDEKKKRMVKRLVGFRVLTVSLIASCLAACAGNTDVHEFSEEIKTGRQASNYVEFSSVAKRLQSHFGGSYLRCGADFTAPDKGGLLASPEPIGYVVCNDCGVSQGQFLCADFLSCRFYPEREPTDQQVECSLGGLRPDLMPAPALVLRCEQFSNPDAAVSFSCKGFFDTEQSCSISVVTAKPGEWSTYHMKCRRVTSVPFL